MILTRTATIDPVDNLGRLIFSVRQMCMMDFAASSPVQFQRVVLTNGEPSAVTLVLEVVRKRSEYWAAVTPAEVGEGPSFMLDVASMRRLVAGWQTMDC
jgi:hypothetical protein